MATLAHFAINADDIDRARRFYGAVFGWEFSAWGPPGFYQIEMGEGASIRGALQQRRSFTPGERIGFEPTFGVESLDAVEKAVLAHGGEIVLARSIIGGVGSLMFFRDPEGNVFGAMQYDPRAQ